MKVKAIRKGYYICEREVGDVFDYKGDSKIRKPDPENGKPGSWFQLVDESEVKPEEKEGKSSKLSNKKVI